MTTPLDRATINKHFRNEEERNTFLRRLKRSMKRRIHQNSAEEFFEDARRIDGLDDNFEFSVDNLLALVDQFPDSKTAMGLLESAICCVIGHEAFENGDIKAAASAYADVYRKNSLVLRWQSSKMQGAMEAFNRLSTDATQLNQHRAEALFVHANILFVRGEHHKGLQRLSLAQLLLPNDPYFPAIEGCILAMQMQASRALQAFKKAETLGCEDPEHTLFHQAILLDLSTQKDGKSSALLQRFVKCAEPDARKLPEACYRLALLHGHRGPRHMGEAKRFYTLGEKAERDGLSVFKDEASQWRIKARALVKHYHECGNSSCRSAGTMDCTACEQVFYCSKVCQKAHWPAHRRWCKKHRKISPTG
ncbi:expressed unknown protein [Seminavis robusta]|uniref:MYND-type domain-containing protein n=1 Tax=Seminavis robusta TaxID=568900 RepID=A0A9N8ES81_9STRA|nr:expressed unknown protein [Seminavis robusta]|eukprot:Sro1501_g277910.1 n/a (363) ;mRNA; r:14847-15935